MGGWNRISRCYAKCLLWVNNGHRRKLNECPLYPRKRTLMERAGMSALCQKEMNGTATKFASILQKGGGA
jgi:hypothetical protein